MAIVQSNEITLEMKQYLGAHSGDLLTLAYQSMDVINDVTFYPDVKNKLILTTLEMDKIVKPFTPEFNPTPDAFRFKPRELDVKVGKAELTLIPEAYRQTYLAQFMTKGVSRTPADMPFEQYLWEAFFAEFGEELNDETAYHGVYNAAGATAIDVADGYGKILADLVTAEEVTPEVLGAITATDGHEQLLQLWRKKVVGKYRKKSWKWTMYMAHKTYEAYMDSLDALPGNVGRGDLTAQKFLRKSDNLCELKPVSWMGSSSRIMLTPFRNILCGGDAVTGDLAKANVQERMWGADIGIAAALGFNFRYAPLLFCNELA